MNSHIALNLTYDQVSAIKLVLDPYTREEDQTSFYLNSMWSTVDALQAEMNFYEEYEGQRRDCKISREAAQHFCSLFGNNKWVRGGEITRTAAIKYIEETGLLGVINDLLNSEDHQEEHETQNATNWVPLTFLTNEERVTEIVNFVTYRGNDEVLVTTKKLEPDAIKEWFTDGGRDIEWYERIEHLPGETSIAISNQIRVL